MVNALWITLIGMSLVFLAILLLWGLMALLVRLTAEKTAAVEEPADALPAAEAASAAVEADGAAVETLSAGDGLHEKRRRAAAAGVAVAMALQQAAQKTPAPPVGLSAWQSVQRASQLGQRNGYSRKVRA